MTRGTPLDVFFNMSLETWEISSIVGRVCCANETPGGCSVTVECYNEKLAFRFVANTPYVHGNWIKFSCKAKFIPGVRKDWKLRDNNLAYIHHPLDGSARCEWTFLMPIPSSMKVHRANMEDVMGTLQNKLRRHVNNPKKNRTKEKVKDTLGLSKLVEEYLRKYLLKDLNPSILIPSVRVT